VETTDRPTKG